MDKTARILIDLLICGVTVLVLATLPPNYWDGWQPATCIRDGCFCETADPHSPIRQAANTLSSLGFVFSGVFAVSRRAGSRFPFLYSILFGISSILIGVGSAFYHASLTFTGQFFDVLGMFMIAVLMLVYAFERIWSLRLTTSIGLYLTINLSLGWMQFSLPDTRRFVFAVVLVIALIFEAYYRRKYAPNITVNKLRLGIILLAAAYIIWMLDKARILCAETSLIQGHALWHLLGAAAVWLLYEYYASEQN